MIIVRSFVCFYVTSIGDKLSETAYAGSTPGRATGTGSAKMGSPIFALVTRNFLLVRLVALLYFGESAWGLPPQCNGDFECTEFADRAIESFIDVFKPDVEAKHHNLGRPADQLRVPCVPRVWLLLAGQYRTFKETR
eukprot:5881642-Pyramimonas_sp.AAC.1